MSTLMQSVDTRRLSARFPGTSAQWYARIKFATDPLYVGARAAMEGAVGPLLDIGCGMGLWGFYLRESGWLGAIHGLDYDDRKIAAARHVAASIAPDMVFATSDARLGLPEHSGSVTILDILQYFSLKDQHALLMAAASRVAPGGRIIIRTGLKTPGWRFTLTKVGDFLAAGTFWMKATPVCYPTSEFLRVTLTNAGLTGSIQPLWGHTPFNNWLIVFTRN